MLALLVRTRLTQNLVELVPQLKCELEHYIGTEFPPCDDWTAVKWQPFALRGIARLSGHAFVGPWLNREEQWLKVTIDFAIDVFMSVIKLQFFPEWTRPLAQYAVPDLRKIRRDIEAAKSLLKPLLEERIRDMELSSCYEPPNDLMQWLIEALPEAEKADVQTHAELQLILAAASIHTTNNLLFECMADLAANPDIQAELREEAYQILEVENGWARKESMAKLKKLDSFMREVQRLRGNISMSSSPSFLVICATNTNSILHPQSHEAHRPLRRHPSAHRHAPARPPGRHLDRRAVLPQPRDA